MEYTPTLEDLKFAKKVNDEVIWTQTLNPNLIKEAYRRLFGQEALNAQQARIKLFAYFQYQFKGFDSTETALPQKGESDSLSVSNEGQSHSEDSDVQLSDNSDNQIINTNTNGRKKTTSQKKKGRKTS